MNVALATRVNQCGRETTSCKGLRGIMATHVRSFDYTCPCSALGAVFYRYCFSLIRSLAACCASIMELALLTQVPRRWEIVVRATLVEWPHSEICKPQTPENTCNAKHPRTSKPARLDKQTHKPANITNIQTNKNTNKQASKQANKQANKQRNK